MPNINFNIIDVRDVADLHIRAMTNPEAKGQRFIGMADGAISLPQIADVLKKKMPDVSEKVTTKVLPDWVVRIAAIFSAQAKTAAAILGINRNVSNDKARKTLGWVPIASKEDAIIASVESMLKFRKLS